MYLYVKRKHSQLPFCFIIMTSVPLFFVHNFFFMLVMVCVNFAETVNDDNDRLYSSIEMSKVNQNI